MIFFFIFFFFKVNRSIWATPRLVTLTGAGGWLRNGTGTYNSTTDLENHANGIYPGDESLNMIYLKLIHIQVSPHSNLTDVDPLNILSKSTTGATLFLDRSWLKDLEPLNILIGKDLEPYYAYTWICQHYTWTGPRWRHCLDVTQSACWWRVPRSTRQSGGTVRGAIARCLQFACVDSGYEIICVLWLKTALWRGTSPVCNGPGRSHKHVPFVCIWVDPRITA